MKTANVNGKPKELGTRAVTAKFIGNDPILRKNEGYLLHVKQIASGRLKVEIYVAKGSHPLVTEYSGFHTFADNWDNIRSVSKR